MERPSHQTGAQIWVEDFRIEEARFMIKEDVGDTTWRGARDKRHHVYSSIRASELKNTRVLQEGCSWMQIQWGEQGGGRQL